MILISIQKSKCVTSYGEKGLSDICMTSREFVKAESRSTVCVKQVSNIVMCRRRTLQEPLRRLQYHLEVTEGGHGGGGGPPVVIINTPVALSFTDGASCRVSSTGYDKYLPSIRDFVPMLFY